MKKTNVLQRIIQKLEEDQAILFGAAQAAHEAATNKENIPDNKYDTLSLEASYVAQGQANRAQELKTALAFYSNLKLREFDNDSEIFQTALVTLENDDGETNIVFIGPQAGGMKIIETGEEVTVITPQSPIGKGLLGKCVGDSVELLVGKKKREFEIIEVQ